MWTIRFRPEIESDLRAGLDWYNSKRDGLGDEFVAEYWAAIDRIADRPLTFAVSASGLRPCRLSRFPYVVYDRVAGHEILIVAVIAAARDSSVFIRRGEP